jgi:hypothetical protein
MGVDVSENRSRHLLRTLSTYFLRSDIRHSAKKATVFGRVHEQVLSTLRILQDIFRASGSLTYRERLRQTSCEIVLRNLWKTASAANTGN